MLWVLDLQPLQHQFDLGEDPEPYAYPCVREIFKKTLYMLHKYLKGKSTL